MSDGALIIDTGLDNKGFIRDAGQFKKAVATLTQAVKTSGQQMAGGMNGYLKALQKAGGAAKAATGEQAALQKEIDKTTASIARMEERQEVARRKFEAGRDEAIAKATEKVGPYKGAEDYDLPFGNPETIEEWQERVSAAVNKAVEDYGTFEESAAFRNSSVDIEYAREKLAGLQAQMAGLAGAAAPAVQGMAGGFANVAAAAGRALVVIGKFAGHAAIGFLKRLAEGAKNAAIQLAKLAGSAISGGMKKLGGFIGRAARSMLGFNKAQKMADGGMKKSLMSILKYGLGIRGLFALFRKLRTAIKEGFEAMSKANPRVKASVDGLKASLNGLKGSLATAFAPILTAVAPALTTLINMLTSAINAIGAFMAALTGQKTYQRAVSGLEATGGAASGAAGDVKKLKRELAGFDDLNILGKSDSSGGGGGGGGGSGSAFSYETEEISSGITDFVQKLKDLWAAADYEGIGREIAGAINGAFAKARQLISWDTLGDKITQAVDAITGIFNGLVDGIDWDGIGRTFGTGINTILNTVNQLLTKIDWANLGKKLAEGLNGLVDEVDWALLGDTLGARFKAALQTLGNFLLNFDWGNLGTKLSQGINALVAKVQEAVGSINWETVGEKLGTGLSNLVTGINWTNIGTTISDAFKDALGFIAKAIEAVNWNEIGKRVAEALTAIDWAGVARKLFEVLGAALGGIAAFIAGVINEAFKGIKDYFDNSIEDAGGNVVLGILNGILNAIKGIGTWIYENIFKPFIDGFKKAFGIASPAKEMEEPGKDILLGIYEGIVTAIRSVGQWVRDNIFAPIWNAIKNLNWSNIGTDIWEAIKTGVSAVGEWFKTKFNDAVAAIKAINWKNVGTTILNFVKNGFGAIKDWFKTKFNEAVAAIKAINWKNVGTTILTFIKNGFGVIKDWFKTKFNDAVTAIKSINWKNVGTTILNAVKNGFGTVKAWFKTKFNDAVAAIKAINWKNVGTTILNFVKNGFGTIKTWFKTKFNDAVAAIKAINWKNVGSAILGFIKNGFGTIKDWFKGKFNDAVTDIKKIDWKKLGSTIWSNIKSGVGSVKDWFVDKFKAAVNAVIKLVNKMIGKAESGVNKIIDGINSALTIDVTIFGKRLYASPGIKKASFGRLKTIATGGMISGGGRLNAWNGVQKYANGTNRAHGSLFVAGEAGPEIIGHVNGRTEILNKSQLAQTMQSAVASGMMAALSQVQIRMPAVASGSLVPYEVSAQIAKSTADLQGTLNANNEDLIQTIISVAGQLVAAVGRIQPGQPSAAGLTAQQVIDEINRRTLMFGASPLKGV